MPINIKRSGSGVAYIIPYSSYTVLFNQSGTSAPIATILENTLGQTVTWTRPFFGQYYGTFETPIPRGKIFMDNGSDYNGNGTCAIPICDNNQLTGYYMFIQDGNDNVARVQLYVFDPAFLAAEYSTILGTTSIPLQFKVYP